MHGHSYLNWFQDSIASYDSFAVCNDRLYFIGKPQEKQRNSLMHRFRDSEMRLSLNGGIPLKDIERHDRYRNKEDIARTKELMLQDVLRSSDSPLKEISNRHTLLRFIVDELFPLMTVPQQNERIDAIMNPDKKLLTGKEILEQALGEDIVSEAKQVSVQTFELDRLDRQLERGYERDYTTVEEAGRTGFIKRDASVFSQTIRGTPLLVIGGKPFFYSGDIQSPSYVLNVDGKNYWIGEWAASISDISNCYEANLAHSIKRTCLEEIREETWSLQENMKRDILYMPLMDRDEFRFKDIGFFRNEDVFYVFRRIPKFARQTAGDENIFLAKEDDGEGFAGEIGIGLRCENNEIRYLGYHEHEGGVVYRGPIKNDAPFHSVVRLVDPTMREKHGDLRTICHVGGYPKFAMNPDGFMQFFNYALGNFLDSFRANFADYHFDSPDQVRALNAGTLMHKNKAKSLGYMLTNIHEVEKE